MDFKLIWSESAIEDLGAIVRFIALRDGSHVARQTGFGFVKGRVRNEALWLKDEFSKVDATQPRWIGISQGTPYITFASSPNVLFSFRLDGNQVTIVNVVQMYE